ncbi:PREDICTED: CASP-like protein 4A1 [Nicotiana attenuata]|uniref:CASP-like protein 4A1 n=1 Tax=Nicotiana attenuata TaxID=49451 RepID=UPI0009057C06|nr:PREDICTED: CASP-like protein 4A1 [Nicotiana attenuata]
MVQSCSRGETTKGRGEYSRSRGRGTLPLGQPKTIRKKSTTGREIGADLSESSSYVPSMAASEGNSASIQEDLAATQSRPHERFQLMDEASLSHSTPKRSECASQTSEPAAAPNTDAQIVQDIPDDGREGDGKSTGVERCQFDESEVVVTETADIPSTSIEPFSNVVAMPPPPSSDPTTAPAPALRPEPMPIAPLSALRVSRITVAAQSSTQAPQVSSDLDEKLKKILDN